jgi:Helix-turn-helix of DDE superfamily endonuclease
MAQQESRLRARRGRDRERAAGAGPGHDLVFTDRVIATLVILRFQLPHAALAQFYGVDRSTITRAVHEIRPLLAARGFAVPGSPGRRLRTLADVFAYAAAEGVILRVDGTEVQVRRPVGAGNPVTSRDLGVFVDQTAEPVPSQDPDIRAQGGRMLAPGRRALVERPVRAMDVTVIDVLAQDQLQARLAGDQHPVQALAPGAGYPPLRDRVHSGRPDRGPDDPHADRSEHGVERSGELGVPVTDQELEVVSAALEVHQEVAGLLSHPLTCGVGGDPGQVHAPGAVLDEEQDVQAPQEHGIDVEEIRGEVVSACPARNTRQASPDRRGAGSMPASLRICHTVDGASLYPRPVSSPWMRR